MKTANEMIKEAMSVVKENFSPSDKITDLQYLEMCLRSVMFTEEMKNRKEVAKLQSKNVKMTFKEDK